MYAEKLLTSQQAEIDLVGPTPPEPGWRAKAKQGFAGSCFVLDWDAKQATCPTPATAPFVVRRDGSQRLVEYASKFAS